MWSKAPSWMLVVICGCGVSPVTQLIVSVDTDLHVPTEIDSVELVVRGPSGGQEIRRLDLASRETLPMTASLVPVAALGPVEVEAVGRLAGREIVRRSAIVTLVRDETRVLPLFLLADCVEVVCEGEETCGDEGCESRRRSSLPPWTGTPPSIGADAGIEDAGVTDADVPADARVDGASGDAGPLCTASSCDDGNPCTRDRCDPEVGCEHVPDDALCDDAGPCMVGVCDRIAGCRQEPREGPCNDGLFCNGFDTCREGTCSEHAGNPCGGGTVCDEATGRCLGCLTNADCPPSSAGGWGACAYGTTCSQTGTRTRTVRNFRCEDNACVPTDDVESEPCNRTTENVVCGDPTCGPFGLCDFRGTCSNMGTRTRTCTDQLCRAGACTGVPRVDRDDVTCVRNTNGVVCQLPESGDCFQLVCSGGSCGIPQSVCGAGQTCCGPPQGCTSMACF
ncbi:MAG: hypothetical protein KF901_06665 [Myxococcales bacterium]|nr:hypothetical protein [Myxococcales bacterium]